MINYDLPKSVTIDGVDYAIRNDGDYRVVLDIISALNDNELADKEKILAALIIFYGADKIPQNTQSAIDEMMRFINVGELPQSDDKKPKLMDWEQDFLMLVPPINKALGFEVRAVPYLHWWTFVSGYSEISKDCVFSTVVGIRQKRSRGEKLEKHEEQFLNENRDIVILKKELSPDEEAFLFGD